MSDEVDFTPEHLAALDAALARIRTEQGPMFEASHWATLLWDRAHQVNDELAPAIMVMFDALAEAQGLERVAIRCWKTEVQGLTAEIQQWRGELETTRGALDRSYEALDEAAGILHDCGLVGAAEDIKELLRSAVRGLCDCPLCPDRTHGGELTK